ncbi:MAG: electron transport complex subunit RsxC, partial [Halomonas venusta]|nr:electron transport complex subunit RsxC [Halomonas venusta]
MPAYEFPGGITPPERKDRSNQSPLRNATLPTRVTLPLKQHSGNPATPCVAIGDAVQVGSLIAQRDGMISANLHASISGTVTQISDSAITIDADGLDRWQTLPS